MFILYISVCLASIYSLYIHMYTYRPCVFALAAAYCVLYIYTYIYIYNMSYI